MEKDATPTPLLSPDAVKGWDADKFDEFFNNGSDGTIRTIPGYLEIIY